MHSATDADEQLMLAYAKGDAGSFEVLYHRHKGGLYRYILRQVSATELAEDLYQECWSRIIKAASSYSADAKWTTWAYRIAHNLVIDHYRSFKPVSSEAEEEASLPASSLQTPERIHEQAVLAGQLTHCLGKLPSVQREVFILSQETDLTLKMIAEVVAASHEAVKTRLRYARSALLACLEKFDLVPGNRENDTGETP